MHLTVNHSSAGLHLLNPSHTEASFTPSHQIDESYIPADFLKADVKVEGNRHIIFATEKQLQLLQKAKRWYMDATFRVVRAPFVQLFSIHAFLKSNNETKQVPLVCALMSRRRNEDYKKVIRTVKNMLQEAPRVESTVMDFEKAMWKAVRSTLPDVAITGCAFHWSQALWRKTQNLGLATEYRKKETTYRYIKKLFALPFLPAEHVVPTFEYLKEKSSNQLKDLVDYIEQTWINNTTWTPDNWSVFGQTIRTNNDVEGWHRRLNYRAFGIPPFYVLIDRLYEESQLLTVQCKLISERKLKKIQRKSQNKKQSEIIQLYKDYTDGQINPMQMLRACSIIYSPPTDD